MTLPDGYRTFVINGTKYLLNNKMNHLMIVPTATAQSIIPIHLSKNGFVMPRVKKNKKEEEGLLLLHDPSQT